MGLFSDFKKVVEESNRVGRKPIPDSVVLNSQDAQFLPRFKQTNRTGKLKLKAAFFNEMIAESVALHHYLNSQTREAYRITCKNGFFYNQKGDLLQGPFIYVLFPDGRLYGCSLYDGKHHSHLSSGLTLDGAGIMYLERGQLVTLSNESGHYKPMLEEMQDAIAWFAKNSNNNFIFEDHSHQDKTKIFNGINYYKVITKRQNGSHVLEPIGTTNLVDAITSLRNTFLQRYLDTFESLDIEDSEAEEEMEDLYAKEKGEKIESLEISWIEKGILDYPELVVHTCLQNLNIPNKQLSRFNCILR
ncbi:MAG: hypothetical protein BGO43_07840 [Gammaproteobacteria bacterium 39-13]|nr:hypothetical protein [Gammaproteobacteria bacterium]OJV93079.1 MAG: hypothetical protein BGO43_07840 [Gammaproteobacteria bacterium 39-13]